VADAARVLMVVTPFLAIVTLGVGLRVGASSTVRAAVVQGAPSSHDSNVRAWPIMLFDDDGSLRQPAARVPMVVKATVAGGTSVVWHGTTNEDGAAELSLDVPPGPLALQADAEGAVVAYGDAADAPVDRRAQLTSAWSQFARREGDVVLDVAMLGQRAASGFASSVWVHATDGKTKAPLGGASLSSPIPASRWPFRR